MNSKQIQPILSKLASWHVDVAGAAACVLVALVVYTVLLAPLQSQRAAYRQHAQDLAARQEEMTTLAGRRFRLRRKLDGLQAQVSAQAVQLRPVGDVNRRVAELTDLIGRCGLKTNNVTLGQVAPGPRCHTIPISLTGAGDYRSCLTFLHELAAPKSDFAVAGFEIKGDPQNPDKPATFNFELYWYAALETAAAAE